MKTQKKTSFTLEQARRLSIKTRWAGKAWEATASIYSGQAVEFFGRDTPVGAITAAKTQAWIDQLLKGGNAAATVNRKLSTLRAMLGDAALHGHLAAIPVLPKQLRANNGRERVIEPQERQQLIYAADALGEPLVADLLVVLLETACRVGEALRLRAADIDLVNRRATFWQTKNGYPRTVPLTTAATAALGRRLAGGEAIAFPLTYEQLRAKWNQVKKHSGVDPAGLVLHSCRHTAATTMAKAGIQMHQLQQFGGWRSSTVSRYMHHNVESLGACVEALEKR